MALCGLIAAAIAAYAWDRANANTIADGVRIGSVDVGGLSLDDAKQRVRRRLVRPLEEPVTATYQGTKYVLSPQQLEVKADVSGMVDRARDASRDGTLPTRVWRYATGGEVDKRIRPAVSYSKDAVDQFVAEVAQQVNQPARNATVQASPAALTTVPEQTGKAVKEDELRSHVQAAIEGAGSRQMEVPVQKVQPEVTVDDLAQKYPTYLTIDRGNFQLRLWQNLELAQTYTVAVGQQGLETPAGTYSIDDKQVNPSWHVPDSAWAGDLAGQVIPPGPEDPLKARWMGFYNGAGIHGTDEVSSIGTAASHGCIRMTIPDVESLYPLVPLHTPIYVG